MIFKRYSGLGHSAVLRTLSLTESLNSVYAVCSRSSKTFATLWTFRIPTERALSEMPTPSLTIRKKEVWRMLTSEEMEKIEENIEDIKNYCVKRIGLFGSYVRNAQKIERERDILVRLGNAKKTFDKYIDLLTSTGRRWL